MANVRKQTAGFLLFQTFTHGIEGKACQQVFQRDRKRISVKQPTLIELSELKLPTNKSKTTDCILKTHRFHKLHTTHCQA